MQKAEENDLTVSHDELEGILNKQEARMRHLRAKWERSEVMLMIFQDEVNGRSALCVQRKNPASVRLYEPGIDRAEGIRKQINALRSALLPEEPEVEAKANVCISGGHLEPMVHYIEAEMLDVILRAPQEGERLADGGCMRDWRS